MVDKLKELYAVFKKLYEVFDDNKKILTKINLK
jgi:hypothetical protein